MSKHRKSSSGFKKSAGEEKGHSPTSVIDLDEEGNDDSFVEKKNKDATSKLKGDSQTLHKENRHYDHLNDDKDELQELRTGNTRSKDDNIKEGSYKKCKLSGPLNSDKQDLMQQSNHQCGSSGFGNEMFIDHNGRKESSGLFLQDIKQVQPSFKSTAETSSSIPLAEPGNRCFTGGLLGPDGSNRYLGKWCKRTQDKPQLGSSSDLIAVGADGRGGRIKVLRSPNKTSADAKDSIVSAKTFKPGAKSSSLQSQGCLQIDHFFRKANN